MTFHELESMYEKNLFLEDEHDYIKVIFGAVIANRMDIEGMHPFWLNIVGPPSSGKSEVLESLESSDEVIPIDLININSLVSGMKKGKNTDDKEPSLLPKLEGKIMLVKDSSTFKTMNPIERNQIFSQLRKAFDGSVSKATGITQKMFDAKFGIFMGSTPASDSDMALDAALGQRFIIFRLKSTSNFIDKWEKVEDRIKYGGNKSKTDLKFAADKYLLSIEKPKEILWDSLFKKHVPHMCELLEDLRTPAIRERFSRNIEVMMDDGKNEPIRIAKQLCSLYTSLIYITGKKNEAINIIYRIMKDNIPPIRLNIIKLIHKNKDITIRDMSCILKISVSSIQRSIEEMQLLNILFTEDGIKPITDSNSKYQKESRTINPKYLDIFSVLPSI